MLDKGPNNGLRYLYVHLKLYICNKEKQLNSNKSKKRNNKNKWCWSHIKTVTAQTRKKYIRVPSGSF